MIVYEPLDLVQCRLTPLEIQFALLLLEQGVDIGIVAVRICDALDHKCPRARGGVAESSAAPFDLAGTSTLAGRRQTATPYHVDPFDVREQEAVAAKRTHPTSDVMTRSEQMIARPGDWRSPRIPPSTFFFAEAAQ
jgi:hypothetical protein